MMTRNVHTISSEASVEEASELVAATRQFALDLFPDKGHTFDLLYRPRLLDAALAAARQSTGPFLLRSTRAGDEQVARLQQAWQ